jgi:hypothetical protein
MSRNALIDSESLDLGVPQRSSNLILGAMTVDSGSDVEYSLR